MKIKVILSVLLVLSVAVFYLSKPNAKENETQSVSGTNSDTFRIGLINMGVQTHFDSLAPLKCNLWHKYLGTNIVNGKFVPVGWTDIGADSDKLYTPLQYYQSQVQGILTSNSGANYSSYIDRPKIEMLTYAQRSDYQCEYISVPDTDNGVDWWYAFDSSDYGTGYTSDSNAIVRHLKPMPEGGNDSPGYIAVNFVSNLTNISLKIDHSC
jgi:hypothetical protein